MITYIFWSKSTGVLWLFVGAWVTNKYGNHLHKTKLACKM